MSLGEVLVSLGLAAAREGYEYAKKRLRKAATDAGIVVAEQQLEAIVGAQMMLMHAATADMYANIVRLKELNEKSERDFRNSSNVTVVESIDDSDDEPTKG